MDSCSYRSFKLVEAETVHHGETKEQETIDRLALVLGGNHPWVRLIMVRVTTIPLFPRRKGQKPPRQKLGA